METFDRDKLERAKKRVEELKGFYIHAIVYLAVNAFIMINIYIRSLDGGERFWSFSTFFVAVFWGIGLAFHAINTFNINPFLSKGWEERQIRKYMEEDEREARKFKK